MDNTRGTKKYFEQISATGIDCTHIEPWTGWDRTFFRCWELIAKRARDVKAYWVLSLEADNLLASEGLQMMVNLALLGRLHLVTHAYPMHETAAKASGIDPKSWYYTELGIMLMTRSLLERAIDEFEEYGNIASAIFNTEQRYHGGYCKLTNCFKVEHLDGYQQSFQNLGPSEIPGLIMPTPSMPADYGTELPECLKQ